MGTASAHEEREVGPIHMAVGFGIEPTYVGQPNSVQVILEDHGKPVVDLGRSLRVTVAFDGQTSDPMLLEPDFEIGEFGTPGDYRAYFVPSQPGAYTFHFAGRVHGTKVDESFTGGPKTFSEAEDLSSATFPPVQAPTASELATRIQQESDRTATGLARVTNASASATDSASSSKTLAIAALLVGALGLVAAIGSLARGRGRT